MLAGIARQLLLICALLSHAAVAFRRDSIEHGPSGGIEIELSGVSDLSEAGVSESDLQQASGVLSTYLQRSELSTGILNAHVSDCHSEVAKSLELSCSKDIHPGGVRGMSEIEQSSIALGLTLCSMASLQGVPKECQAWWSMNRDRGSSGTWSGWTWKRRNLASGDHRINCLRAINRSSQDWTTYNTHLSESVRHCFMLEHRRRDETANDLYKRVVEEKLALMKLLRRDQAMRADSHARNQEETNQLLTKLDQRMEWQHETFQALRDQTEQNAALVQQFERAVESLATSAGETLERFERGGRGFHAWLVSEISRRMDGLVDLSAYKTELALRDSTDQHALNLSNVAELAISGLREQQSRLASDLASLHKARLSEEASMLTSWQAMTANVSALGNNLGLMTLGMADLHPRLTESLTMATALQAIHINLTNLTSRTLEQLPSILEALSIANSTLGTLAREASRQPFQLSLLSGPSLFPASSFFSGSDSSLPRSLIAYCDIFLRHSVQLLIFVISNTLTLLAAAWLILRTGFFRAISKLSRELLRGTNSGTSSPDVEQTLSHRGHLQRPAPKEQKAVEAVHAHVRFENEGQPLRQRKSYGTLRRSSSIPIRSRRAFSEPP